jgi:small subunit ribosomal protein S26e
MPISTAPYKRKYYHTKSRGRETTVICDGCKREVPRYKTFLVTKRFGLNDPILLQQVDKRFIHTLTTKLRYCPSCARFRGIAQPGKSVRKSHLKI